MFGRDIGMLSTFVKYDPCVTGANQSVECSDCMVWLTEARNRIMIRFDTKGMIFGKIQYADYFYVRLHPPKE